MGLFSAFKQNLYDITNLDREEVAYLKYWRKILRIRSLSPIRS